MATALPPLSRKDEDMKGLIHTSNWVIKRKLIAGAYPGSPQPDKHTETIKSVVAAGNLLDAHTYLLHAYVLKENSSLISFCSLISCKTTADDNFLLNKLFAIPYT